MKGVLKIAKVLAVIVAILLVVLITASFLLKDKVGDIILASLNRNLSTTLEVGSYRLSFLKRFPRATLDLKNVVVHSSPGFKKSDFGAINADTLLSAKAVSLEFRLIDIITGNYTIDRIGAKGGRANFFTDSEGRVNYIISNGKSAKDDNKTKIDLRRIYVSNMQLYYNNLSVHLLLKGYIGNGRMKSRINGSNIDFVTSTDLNINLFSLLDFTTDKKIKGQLELDLLSSAAGIRFRKGILTIDDFNLGITGLVSPDNFVDLDVSGKNLDIKRLRSYVPDKYLSGITEYNPSGKVNITGKIKGLMTHKLNPHVELDWQLSNGRVVYSKSDIVFKDISFSGHLSNGSRNCFASSTLSVNDFRGRLGSSEYTGSAVFRNFDDVRTDLSLSGKVYPAEIKEFFNLTFLSSADGSADVDLKFVNSSLTKKNLTFNDVIDFNPESTISFNSMGLGFSNDKILFRKINGNMTIAGTIKAKDVTFVYRNQQIRVNGEFRNLPEWATGRNVTMSATADVAFDKLIPEAFFSDPGKKGSAPPPRAVNLPEDMILDVRFRIDSMAYKTFTSSKIEGMMHYKPKTFVFTSLRMHALSGLITGNCFFSQNSTKEIMAKGNFNVSDIDVNRAFRSFSNFGQSFLKAENINGELSGSLSLLVPLDSMLKFKIRTLTAEGHYLLMNGALINFDPVKQLSTFIDIKELEDIHFEKLENDFFIRNNYLYIPQMDVNSSAADLSVNGRHSFDNDYEYHVKIRLSEILSRKRVKKSNVTEFGVVEDDGLGRTSLLLKIVGKGEEAKVSYDMKAAGTQVKNSIKKEKENLKTILNQEYGWYKGDSAVNSKPAVQEKKNRFRITWDDGEAAKSPPVKTEEKKEKPFSRIFKKD